MNSNKEFVLQVLLVADLLITDILILKHHLYMKHFLTFYFITFFVQALPLTAKMTSLLEIRCMQVCGFVVQNVGLSDFTFEK